MLEQQHAEDTACVLLRKTPDWSDSCVALQGAVPAQRARCTLPWISLLPHMWSRRDRTSDLQHHQTEVKGHF